MAMILHTVLPLLLAGPPAHATEAPGRIRRIRIREQADGANFRAVVQTESGDPTDPGALSVTVSGLETGATATLSGRARSTRVMATGTASWAGKARPIEHLYTMTAQMRGVADPTQTYDWTAEIARCTADCAWAEELLGDGTVAQARVTFEVADDGSDTLVADLRIIPPSGSRGAVAWTLDGVVFEGDDVDGDGVADEAAEASLGTSLVYRTRWTTPNLPDDGLDAALQIDATLTNPDGSIDALTDFTVLDLGGETGLLEASSRARRRGGYRIDLYTQSTGDDPVGSVFAEITDADSDEVLGELDLDTASETVSILTARLPSTLVSGERVGATVTLYAGDQPLLAEALTFSVTAGTLSATFGDSADLALHVAGIYALDDGSFELSFSVVGTDAVWVDAAVVELSARMTAGTVDGAVESRWQRWTGVLDTAATPSRLGLDVEVRGDDGVGLDGWEFDIQAQYGTGTRSSAGQARQKAELL